MRPYNSPFDLIGLDDWITREPEPDPYEDEEPEEEEDEEMFSVRQKQEIAAKIEAILRETKHPELPNAPINFELRVWGRTGQSWAVIIDNARIDLREAIRTANPHNEKQDPRTR